MEEIVVRPGTRDDLDGLAELVSDPDRRDRRVRDAEAGREALLVAAVADRLVGALSVRWDGRCDPPSPWLYGAKVHADWRSRGIGTRLWQQAHRLCSSRGYDAVSLDVDVDNEAARRLYERLGYVTVGPHLHRWVTRDSSGRVVGGGAAETWLMRCRLRNPGGGAR